jgi:hypothetical protein
LVKISDRTAHRVRFISFADVASGGTGFRRVLWDWLGRSNDDWRTLAPSPLRPVHQPHDFDEADFKTHYGSRLGTQEAWAFAQHLGIGHHVPCILIVNEVRSRQIDLFPIRDMAAKDIYLQLSKWVDDFYTANRAIFNRWLEVEREIIRLKDDAGSSLSRIRKWREETVPLINAAESIKELITDLASLPEGKYAVWREALEGAATQPLPMHVREQFSESLKDANQLLEWHEQSDSLKPVLRQLEAARSANELLAPLKDLIQQDGNRLPKEILRRLRALRNNVGDRFGILTTRCPAMPIVKWWIENLNRRFPGRKRYMRERARWVWPCNAPEIDREWALLREQISSLPITCNPNDGAAAAVQVLATHLGVREELTDWEQQAETLRLSIAGYLTAAQRGRPEVVEADTLGLNQAKPESFRRPFVASGGGAAPSGGRLVAFE